MLKVLTKKLLRLKNKFLMRFLNHFKRNLLHLLSIECDVQTKLRKKFEVSAMQEELDQFARLKVWRLVPRPKGKTIINTKWIFKNKKDESSLVIGNKARLVAQGYHQEQGIDYDEMFAPVS
ncbi:retrovirus-related pol polyprotein from transposon TNT 1-94 [Tanacetum coccineum]